MKQQKYLYKNKITFIENRKTMATIPQIYKEKVSIKLKDAVIVDLTKDKLKFITIELKCKARATRANIPIYKKNPYI